MITVTGNTNSNSFTSTVEDEIFDLVGGANNQIYFYVGQIGNDEIILANNVAFGYDIIVDFSFFDNPEVANIECSPSGVDPDDLLITVEYAELGSEALIESITLKGFFLSNSAANQMTIVRENGLSTVLDLQEICGSDVPREEPVIYEGDNGSEEIVGLSNDDVLAGDNGDDIILGNAGDDDISGGNGSDASSGGAGDDTISGGNGADTLDGGSGNDTLDGGKGADILIGGAGDDFLTGGKGADLFDFSFTADQEGNDVITDYGLGPDLIQIEGVVFSDLAIFQGNDGAIVANGYQGGDLQDAGSYMHSIHIIGTDASSISSDDFQFV